MPKPSSFSSGIPPSLLARLSILGPISRPKMSRKTTSGIFLPVSRERIGDSNATNVIQKMDTNWPLSWLDPSDRVVPEARRAPDAPKSVKKSGEKVENIKPQRGVCRWGAFGTVKGAKSCSRGIAPPLRTYQWYTPNLVQQHLNITNRARSSSQQPTETRYESKTSAPPPEQTQLPPLHLTPMPAHPAHTTG